MHVCVRALGEGSGGGEAARDLFEELSSEGRLLALPGRPLPGFPHHRNSRVLREPLSTGGKPDVGFPEWGWGAIPSDLPGDS